MDCCKQSFQLIHPLAACTFAINSDQISPCPVCINTTVWCAGMQKREWEAHCWCDSPIFSVLTSSGLPSFVTPPSSDWGEGEGPANLSGLHSSQHFTSYLSRLDGGIMGGRGAVLLKCCALKTCLPLLLVAWLALALSHRPSAHALWMVHALLLLWPSHR